MGYPNRLTGWSALAGYSIWYANAIKKKKRVCVDHGLVTPSRRESVTCREVPHFHVNVFIIKVLSKCSFLQWNLPRDSYVKAYITGVIKSLFPPLLYVQRELIFPACTAANESDPVHARKQNVCESIQIYCDDRFSLSSTTAVQIWIISYILHIISDFN